MIDKICNQCKKEFQINSWRLKDPTRGKFCSHICSCAFHSGENHWSFGRIRLEVRGANNKRWKGGKPDCVDCGKKLTIYGGIRCQRCNLYFHSGENHYLFGKNRSFMSKEKNPNWKGGITKQNKIERVRFTQTIQKKVFERDNYICQMCQSKTDLQVDHIQSWAEYVELRFDINNCRTLCAKCHYKITFGKDMPEHIKSWGHNLIERVRIIE